MNLKGTESLLKILRAYGVSHFKSPEMEIRIGDPPSHAPDSLTAIGSPSSVPKTSKTKAPKNAAAAPPVQVQIPHHVNEVQRLLKLNDEQLVDALFPEGAHPNPAVGSALGSGGNQGNGSIGGVL